MNGGFIGDPEEVGVDRGGLEQAIRLLEEQREEGLHGGAQPFVARKGQPVIDMAIARQMERGQLKLDDRVQSFIPEFANGNEACTVKHVLTHTGGFRMNAFLFLLSRIIVRILNGQLMATSAEVPYLLQWARPARV